MITQVINKDGKVYDVVYPKNPIVELRGDDGELHARMHLETVLSTYRSFWVDGELAQSGLEPWERYRYSFPKAKERWKAVERIFTDNGFEVSHNGQDMFIRRGDYENKIACEVVMNNPVTSIFGVEWDSYENWNRKQNI